MASLARRINTLLKTKLCLRFFFFAIWAPPSGQALRYIFATTAFGGMEIKRVAKDAAAILGAMRFTRYHRLYNEKQNGVYFMANEHHKEDSLQTIDKFLKACVQSTANLAMKTANRVKTIPMHLFNFVQ